MANLFYMLCFLVVILLALAFGSQNSELVSFDLIFFTLPPMQLFVLVLGAFAVGVIVGLIPSMTSLPFMRLKLKAVTERVKELENNATQ